MPHYLLLRYDTNIITINIELHNVGNVMIHIIVNHIINVRYNNIVYMLFNLFTLRMSISIFPRS